MHENSPSVNKVSTRLRVSAHAVRRYLEREAGWVIPRYMTDAEVIIQLKKEVGKRGLRAVENRIAAEAPALRGAVIKDNTVITVKRVSP